MNFGDFCQHMEAFLVYIKVEKNLSVHTYRAYESDLHQLVEFGEGVQKREKSKYSVQTILERYFISLYHKKIDKSSIARKISCIRSYEKFIEKNQQIKLNLQLVRPRIDKKLPVYLSVDEIFYLLDSVAPEKMPTQYPLRDKSIFELLYATGIRCSELVAIKIHDINFSERTIIIQGKGKKERVALFGTACEKKLLNYLSQERPPIKHTAEHLFLNYREEPITTRSVQRICGMFREFLDIKRPVTPHKLRHSFATHLLHQGADLRTVQELLGHKTMASTEKYTHVSLEHLTKLCTTNHPLEKKKSSENTDNDTAEST